MLIPPTIEDAYTLYDNACIFFYSGILSKDPIKRADKAIKSLLIPFVIFSILSVIFGQLRHGIVWNIQTLNILLPKGFMWYLGALFWMVLLLPHIIKMRYPLLVTSIVSLVSSLFLQDAYAYCAMGIAFSMLPMFLLGYYTPIDFCQKANKSLLIIGGIIGIVGIVALTMHGDIYFRFRPHFYHRCLSEELVKFLCFAFSVPIALMVIRLMPNKKNLLTTIGKNSLLVYIFHECIYSFIGHLFDVDNDFLDLIIAITISISVSYLLSRNCFLSLYNHITTPINKIFLKCEQ